MADWYVSSVAWAAITQFATSHAYTVGQIIRPLATPAAGKSHAFRCTTAGTSAASEPTWGTTNNSTTTSGGAVFTNVTGQSTYGWSAASGDLFSITNSSPGGARAVAGDRIFISSDSSETGVSTNYSLTTSTLGFGSVRCISVNRAGSVPPVEADILAGAAITTGSSSPFILDAYINEFWQGVTFTIATSGAMLFASSANKARYFKNCAFVITNAATGNKITANDPSKIYFDNTTVQFGNAGQYMGSNGYMFDLTWFNTASAIQGATLPTNLFSCPSANGANLITCRGVDFSAVTGTLVGIVTSTIAQNKILFDSCYINAGVTRYATPSNSAPAINEIELVNCWDGTYVINERYTDVGGLVTDRATYASSPAITLVQGNIHGNGGSSSNTCAVTLGSPIGVGNYAVAYFGGNFNTTDAIQIEDDKGNVYLPGDIVQNSGSYTLKTAYLLNITNAPSTITATNSTQSVTFLTIAVEEYVGTAYTFLDGHGAATQNSVGTGADAVTTGVFTTSNDGDTICAYAISISGVGLAPGTGFTLGDINSASTFMSEYKTVGVPGSAAATATLSSSDNTVIGAMAFNPGGVGAIDDVGAYSLRVGASSRSDVFALPFDCFTFDVENAAVGSSRTATVEIASNITLNNTDVRLSLQYMGTSGNPVASFGDTLSSALATSSVVTSSSQAWTGATYSAWNQFDALSMALTNNALTATATATASCSARALTGYSTGKYYFECTMTTWGTNIFLGLCTGAFAFSGSTGTTTVNKAGTVAVNGSSQGSGLGSRSNGDVIGIAVDLGNALIWFRVAPSGNWNGSGTANPATGTGGFSISALTGPLFPVLYNGRSSDSDVSTVNFGASSFTGSVPSGFTSGWSGTPSSTQKLQVTFTPQRAGRIRGVLKLGRPTTTIWANPQITVR